jgi:hypothetical protein
MMSDKMALKIAIDLLHVPSQVRLVRSGPLPDGVLMLLRIAAGDDEAERAAAEMSDRSLEIVRRAATFFIEQILFAPNADSYQVLGTSPEASAGELRRNVALLLRWLHPDLGPQSERSIFVGRVTAAWNSLKTPERRAAYNDLQRRANDGKFRGKTMSGRRGSRRQIAADLPAWKGRGSSAPALRRTVRVGFIRRALSIILQRPV